MKKILAVTFAAFVFAAFATTSITLAPGLNVLPGWHAGGGKVLAVEAVTQNAAATVALSSVRSVTTYTNQLFEVVTPHDLYSFSITNYDGNAAISTNTVDVFSYSDWMRGTTNLIVGAVTHTRFAETNTVAAGRLPSTTYTVTNALLSVTTSGHYGTATPESSKFVFGGAINVSGAAEDDVITLIVE